MGRKEQRGKADEELGDARIDDLLKVVRASCRLCTSAYSREHWRRPMLSSECPWAKKRAIIKSIFIYFLILF